MRRFIVRSSIAFVDVNPASLSGTLVAVAMVVAFSHGVSRGQSRGVLDSEIRIASHGDIIQDIQTGFDRITVVNMWATWCAPCVEEFPHFVRLAHEDEGRGLRVLFVSLDLPEDTTQVRDFLRRQGWTSASYVKTGKDNAFVNTFSASWSGALPATFIYDSTGTLIDEWEGGPVQFGDLAKRVRGHYTD
jgi:thiol-disulfide isomerase/thioredoxin